MQASTRLYALTNWSAETFPIALERYEFLHWFDGRLVSGEEKTRKPFADIYEKLLSRFNINPLKQFTLMITFVTFNLLKSWECIPFILKTLKNLRKELIELELL